MSLKFLFALIFGNGRKSVDTATTDIDKPKGISPNIQKRFGILIPIFATKEEVSLIMERYSKQMNRDLTNVQLIEITHYGTPDGYKEFLALEDHPFSN